MEWIFFLWKIDYGVRGDVGVWHPKNKNIFVQKIFKNLNNNLLEESKSISLTKQLCNIFFFKFLKIYSKNIFIIPKIRKYQFKHSARVKPGICIV